jgi:hypothetical protein
VALDASFACWHYIIFNQKETKAMKFSLMGERKSLALKINLGEKGETPIYPRLRMRT